MCSSNWSVEKCGTECDLEDSSKENSLVDGFYPSPKTNEGRYHEMFPWGCTLTPSSSKNSECKCSDSKIIKNSSSYLPGVSWDDLSFVAEAVSPGFTSRVAKNVNALSPNYLKYKKKYPTGQEKLISAGILPNVKLKSKGKTIISPKQSVTSPLLPLSLSTSPFSSRLSSDFLSSSPSLLKDVTPVSSVLQITSNSEKINDPTSVHAVVTALQNSQVGRGIKRTCFSEQEDYNKKPNCGTNVGSKTSLDMTNNLSKSMVPKGEKRALDLSPSVSQYVNDLQISPENKRHCVIDPRTASLSSSQCINSEQRDSDSDSSNSIGSRPSKDSDHPQVTQESRPDLYSIIPTSEEKEVSDHSGSHTPQSNTRWGLTSSSCTSRTSTPRHFSPPRPTHIITLEAYKSDKIKNQHRLQKMLGIIFQGADAKPSPPFQFGSANLSPPSGFNFSSGAPGTPGQGNVFQFGAGIGGNISSQTFKTGSSSVVASRRARIKARRNR